MSSATNSFVALASKGEAILDDIDDFVDAWHDGDIDVPLHQYLGMTDEEYRLFLADNSSLALIVKAHKNRIPISELMNEENDFKIAARSEKVSQYSDVVKWVKDLDD